MQKIDEFRLFDDDFMSEVLNHNNELVTLIIRIILERDDLEVISVETQSEHHNSAGRSVTFDVEAKDESGHIYDIEIQRSDYGAGEKRARVHSSMIDKELLAKNENFESITDTYVIFITEHDYFGLGKPLYHIDRTIREADYSIFDDGAHIIYVNGAYRDISSPVGMLMHDFGCRKADEMIIPAIAERIRYYKESEGGRSQMCRIVEDLIRENAAIVTSEVSLRKSVEIARSLILGTEMDAKTIASFVKLPVETVEELVKSLRN